MDLLGMLKAVAKRVAALIPEKKLVHRGGTVFSETYHVKPPGEPPPKRQTKKKVVPKRVVNRAKELDKGHPVKFKTPDSTYYRTGIISRVNPNTYTVTGKRNNEGVIPTYRVPKAEVIPLKDYRQYVQQPARKTAPEKISTEGDRANANYNLAAEELQRRKHVIEKRLGFKEDEIIKHPSFVGPAIKITSELAKENGINPTVRESSTASLWHRASNADHQEMLFAYTLGALKAWRRILSEESPAKAADTKMNVKQFKDVIKGKRHSSYTHMVMEKEGKSAAIKYLQELRQRRDILEDTDISEMQEDPAGRRILERHSTQPQQLNYTLAVNDETLGDDLKKVIATLSRHEREVLRAKYGFHPYEMTPEEIRDTPNKGQRTNEEVADLLNERHVKNPESAAWNRNHVGDLLTKVITGIKNSPAKDELSFHYDQKLGRKVWKSQEDALEDLATSYPEVEVTVASRGICLVMTEELRKSFSSDLAKNQPGGRWITITDESSPLNGRHIYILPHRDGSATVLVGGGPALRHKTLVLKRHDEPKKEEEPEKKEEPKEGEEPKPEPAPEPEKKEAPVMTEEQSQEINQSIKVLTKEITTKRKEMYDFVKERWGVEVDLTEEDKHKIEKKVESIANPVERAVAEGLERKRVMDEKDKALHDIIKGAKAALMEEHPAAKGIHGIAAVVKEHAEDLVAMSYAIQQLGRDRRDLRRMVRVGKAKDKFRSGEEILADLHMLDSEEIKAAISDEQALEKELAAHYRLVKRTRGIEGIDTKDDVDGKLKGEKELQRNIKQGGFETVTGFVGSLAKRAIVRKRIYDELGSTNAALLVKYYLLTTGHDVKGIAEELQGFITAENNPVAYKANDRGAYFLRLANKVREFGRGAHAVMSVAQAGGTALRYQNKAYEAYGQAEGALNQAAEILYALQGRGVPNMEFGSAYSDSLDHKRLALGLRKSDVTIKKRDGQFVMTVKPGAYEKMLTDDPTFAHGHGLGLEYSPDDIKDMKANTDDFFPAAINAYTPPDSNGMSEKVTMRPHEQAAARLIAQQKKVFLNFEAGTGKSKVVLVAKAHLDEVDGTQHKMIVGMPKNLLNNFADEVKKWTGYNVIKVHGGISAARRKKLYEQADGNTIVLCTHETFGNDAVAIKEANFGIVVADEAHKITQREGREDSQKSSGLRDVAEAAQYYIPMTGSAATSDLSELYFHLHVCDPETYSSQKEFMAQFGSSHKGVGYKQPVKEFLNSQLSNNVYSLRKDISAPLYHQTHHVKLTKKQEAAYREVMDKYSQTDKGRNSGLARDQELAYLLNGADNREGYNFEHNAKYTKLRELIDEHLKTKGPDEKIGIYMKNRATINEVQRFLAQYYPQYSHTAFTGSTDKREIDGLKRRVLHDPKTMFSLHMKAGVEGLNLQHSKRSGGLTTMIALASGEDSYSTIDQFLSRGWRTGADKPIHGHTILTDSPFDMGTGLRLEEKMGLKELVGEKGDKAKATGVSFMAKAIEGVKGIFRRITQ